MKAKLQMAFELKAYGDSRLKVNVACLPDRPPEPLTRLDMRCYLSWLTVVERLCRLVVVPDGVEVLVGIDNTDAEGDTLVGGCIGTSPGQYLLVVHSRTLARCGPAGYFPRLVRIACHEMVHALCPERAHSREFEEAVQFLYDALPVDALCRELRDAALVPVKDSLG